MEKKFKRAITVLTMASMITTLTGSGRTSLNREVAYYEYGIDADDVFYNDHQYNQINGYEDCTYNDSITDSIPLYPTGFYVPQGITYYNDYILVSLYDYTCLSNSYIYVLDLDGKVVNKCKLDINSHVGGISYDDVNNLLWVSSNEGKVNAYKINSIINNKSASEYYGNLNIGFDLINYKDEPSVSYLTTYNNHLYVGNYVSNGFGTLKEYSINILKDKSVILSFVRKIEVPNMVQGVSIFEHNDNTYIAFSRSNGLNRPSLLQIYNYGNESFTNNDCVSYEAPSMMEQVVVNDDSLYSVYESGSKPYKNFVIDSTNDIFESDINKLIKKR